MKTCNQGAVTHTSYDKSLLSHLLPELGRLNSGSLHCYIDTRIVRVHSTVHLPKSPPAKKVGFRPAIRCVLQLGYGVGRAGGVE